jgi:hypothetical protein
MDAGAGPWAWANADDQQRNASAHARIDRKVEVMG